MFIRRSRLRKLESRIEKLESRIEKCEDEIRELKKETMIDNSSFWRLFGCFGNKPTTIKEALVALLKHLKLEVDINTEMPSRIKLTKQKPKPKQPTDK